MNRPTNSSIDWQELDRLVDGRLDDNEYRELLCQIDADSDGWRQCALAFLERQAMEKEFSALLADPAGDLFADSLSSAVPASVALAKPETSRRVSASSVAGWMTMALCVFAGVAVGFTLQSDFKDRTRSQTPVLTADQSINRAIGDMRESPVRPSGDSLVLRNQPADTDGEAGQQNASNGNRKQRRCDSARHRCPRRTSQDYKSQLHQYDSMDDCSILRQIEENSYRDSGR